MKDLTYGLILGCYQQDGGFLNDSATRIFAGQEPLLPVVMRCGRQRFLLPVAMVEAVKKLVKADGDYIRDVSIAPCALDEAAEWLNKQGKAIAAATVSGNLIAKTPKEILPGLLGKLVTLPRPEPNQN